MTTPQLHTLYFDGASKGNPGKAACGYILLSGSTEVGRGGASLGIATNNRAEYSGLEMGLQYAVSKGIKKLEVKGDSLLVISQMTGKWKVNVGTLRQARDRCRSIISSNGLQVSFTHIPRSENSVADGIADDYVGQAGSAESPAPVQTK